ncbi:hypothetical protein DFJ73DRAFT_810862 [Zopfochytrium polystomum]|nr:hypothetical protein DFJ73DRAFT_810862 [Zopfochytrium polystomum]
MQKNGVECGELGGGVAGRCEVRKAATVGRGRIKKVEQQNNNTHQKKKGGKKGWVPILVIFASSGPSPARACTQNAAGLTYQNQSINQSGSSPCYNVSGLPCSSTDNAPSGPTNHADASKHAVRGPAVRSLSADHPVFAEIVHRQELVKGHVLGGTRSACLHRRLHPPSRPRRLPLHCCWHLLPARPAAAAAAASAAVNRGV